MTDRAAKTESAEIEITPEMIAAGVDALYQFDINEPTQAEMEHAVRSVFVVMFEARKK